MLSLKYWKYSELYFIKHNNSQINEDKNDVVDMTTALRAMSETLNNLAYVHAYIEDSSASSLFLDTSVSINKALNEASFSLKEQL